MTYLAWALGCCSSSLCPLLRPCPHLTPQHVTHGTDSTWHFPTSRSFHLFVSWNYPSSQFSLLSLCLCFLLAHKLTEYISLFQVDYLPSPFKLFSSFLLFKHSTTRKSFTFVFVPHFSVQSQIFGLHFWPLDVRVQVIFYTSLNCAQTVKSADLSPSSDHSSTRTELVCYGPKGGREGGGYRRLNTRQPPE